jgi:2-phospho-L-lactate/phosphoenolpyruvate guanylyltransferase
VRGWTWQPTLLSPGPTLVAVSTPDGHVAVLIPVKAFGEAKARLADALTPAERIRLARSMATAVVAAAGPLPVHIVCDDDEVADWARSIGAEVIWTPGLGLNGAVTDGVAALAALGFRRAIVAHADLPHARGFDAVLALAGDIDAPTVVIVPDRHQDGTNVICIPTDRGFSFAYGPGSARRHGHEARRLGLPLEILEDARLGWDVDRPDDLHAPDWSSEP